MPLDDNPTSGQAAPWPEIDRSLLDETRPPPAPFPLTVLPGRWRAWVEASAQSFTPVDYLAQGLLAAAASVCGGGVSVHVTPHWGEPLVLWQALVGAPSTGKTPALAAARRLLGGNDAADAGEEGERDEDEHDGGERNGADAPAVLGDGSLEQLMGAAARCPRGAVLWRDELGDWMAAARRDNERAAWLAGWSAGEAMVRRRGLFPLALERFALGVVGCLRPEPLAAIGEGDDGIAARFLFAWPEAGACVALGDRPADDPGLRALLQRIAGITGAATPGVMPFEPEAVARLERLLPELGRRRREADGVEAAWIGKGAGTIVRLAALLALMQWAQDSDEKVPDGVAPRHVEDAQALWFGYFLPHAQDVFRRAGLADRDRTARRAARWLRRMGLDRVSREDIRREALSQSTNADGAEQVIARLEAGGVLRALVPQADGRRGPVRRRWEVNPALR